MKLAEPLPVKVLWDEIRGLIRKSRGCEQRVSVPVGARGRNNKYQDACPNIAKFKVGGRMLCVRHAQAEALKILLRSK